MIRLLNVIRSLKWIRNLLFENFGWKVLSLALAVVIWAVVATEPELATFANVGLEYKNLPEGLEIASDPVSSVVLELRGPSGALRGLGDAIHPAVVIDMSGAQSGRAHLQHRRPECQSDARRAPGARHPFRSAL